MTALFSIRHRPSLPTVVFAAAALIAALNPEAPDAAELSRKARPIGDVTAERLLGVDDDPGQWMTGGRDWRQSYYSPLSRINKTNSRKLGFAWEYRVDSRPSLQATPVVVDGVMFTSGGLGNVYALDASTGAERWSFRPKIDLEVFRKHCCGGVNRGVAVWRGKVYVASLDGYLYALDADRGGVVWKADTFVDRTRAYSSTGAPYIAKDRVIIGNSGAEYDARGYITAFDVQTGKQAWRFFTVPGDPKKGFEHPELEMAARTWDPNSAWELGLGGTVWDGMAYDPKLNLLYVGTGNGLPWNRKLRSPAGGDNLFLSSILAINPDTGRLVWHYQTTPGDNWDFTATQKTILADLRIGGRNRTVIMQAPKNGFFYVLDRATGELLSAQPFVYVNWASQVDIKTGRPVETDKGDYSQAPKLVFPQDQGGHNWHPMAYNPATGLVYIPTLAEGSVYAMPSLPFERQDYQWNHGVAYEVISGKGTQSLLDGGKGSFTLEELKAGEPDPHSRTYLTAWDPVRQRLAWQVETTGPNQSRQLGGASSTAGGLVFQGLPDGRFSILDAATGTRLHSIDVGDRMLAAPTTYEVGGQQYVAIMANGATTNGNGNLGRIVAFRLGGGAVPKLPTDEARAGRPPSVFPYGSPAQLELGEQLFGRHCAVCHANDRAPDLAKMSEQANREFMGIVLEGRRADKGMSAFNTVLSAQDARAIHAFVTDLAWSDYRKSQSQSAPAAATRGTICAEPREGDRPVSLLVVTGSHDYEASEFFATFASMRDVTYRHLYLKGGRPVSYPLGGLGRYDVILFFDFEPGAITPEWRNLLDLGGSFVFLHHAIGTFPTSPEIKEIIGGHANFAREQIAGMPNTTYQHNVLQRFTMTGPPHPVTCGVGDFDMLDEAYDNMSIAPGVNVLMTSDFPKITPAAAWTWSYRDKRVVYLQPGHGSIGLPADHGPSSYQSEPFKKLLERAVQWAAGRL